jgi:ABC-type transport system involved in multi-copper enzyme maturation permease subunit
MLAGAVRSEWVKLRSLRSTAAAYAAVAVVLVALDCIVLTLPEGTSDDPVLTAFLLGELLVAGIAVLATAGEYSAGTARTTFTAVPRRLPVLVAKLVVHNGTLLTLLVLAAAVGWTLTSVAAPDAAGSPLDPVVRQAVLGSMLALCCVVVLGASAGSLTRSPATGLTAVFVLLVVPVVVVTQPAVSAYLPGRAVLAMVLGDQPAEAQLLAPWTAAAVLVGWAAGAAVLAAGSLRRGDV